MGYAVSDQIPYKLIKEDAEIIGWVIIGLIGLTVILSMAFQVIETLVLVKLIVGIIYKYFKKLSISASVTNKSQNQGSVDPAVPKEPPNLDLVTINPNRSINSSQAELTRQIPRKTKRKSLKSRNLKVHNNQEYPSQVSFESADDSLNLSSHKLINKTRIKHTNIQQNQKTDLSIVDLTSTNTPSKNLEASSGIFEPKIHSKVLPLISKPKEHKKHKTIINSRDSHLPPEKEREFMQPKTSLYFQHKTRNNNPIKTQRIEPQNATNSWNIKSEKLDVIKPRLPHEDKSLHRRITADSHRNFITYQK